MLMAFCDLALDLEFAKSEFVVIEAKSEDHFGVWYTNNAHRDSRMLNDIYVYTDRPIYRPGENRFLTAVPSVFGMMSILIPGSFETLDVTINANYGSQRLAGRHRYHIK